MDHCYPFYSYGINHEPLDFPPVSRWPYTYQRLLITDIITIIHYILHMSYVIIINHQPLTINHQSLTNYP